MENLYKKAQQYLDQMAKLNLQSDALNYKKAICFICLENYPEAQKQFAKAFHELQFGFNLWSLSNQPDLLLDTCVLSGQASLAVQVVPELYDYAKSRRKKSYLDYYSLVLLNLVANLEDTEMDLWITKLLDKSTVKEGVEMGNVFKAIIESNQNHFDSSLQNLLDLHKKAARYGSLRGTPEGLVNLNALSIAYCASRRNLKINHAGSDFPVRYVKFLLT